MKKLFWLHSHFLFNAGATRFVYEVATRLSHKYKVIMVVEKASSNWKKLYQEKGIEVREINALSSNSLIYWAFFPIFLVKDWLALRTIIQKTDIVVASMFPMNFLGTLVSDRVLNYCFEPFAFFHDKRLQQSFPLIKSFFLTVLSFMYKPLDIYGTKNAQYIVAINPSVGKFITLLYNRTVEIYTYLGIDYQMFNQKQLPLFKKNKDKVLIFHSTDFTSLKGTEYLFRALRKVKNKSKIQMFISESVQNIKAKKHYEFLVSEFSLGKVVSFIGHIPYSDLPKMYASSDIYCFTGDPLSLGASAASLSVLEAEACGVPVIRSIGNKDEVQAGKTGLIVDPRDSQALAKAIEQLASSIQLRHRLGKAGSAWVQARYTWGKVTNRLETVLKKL